MEEKQTIPNYLMALISFLTMLVIFESYQVQNRALEYNLMPVIKFGMVDASKSQIWQLSFVNIKENVVDYYGVLFEDEIDKYNTSTMEAERRQLIKDQPILIRNTNAGVLIHNKLVNFDQKAKQEGFAEVKFYIFLKDQEGSEYVSKEILGLKYDNVSIAPDFTGGHIGIVKQKWDDFLKEIRNKK